MPTESLREVWCDRDLGWLEFNRRVLAEAQDERVPLLERLKFVAIFASNLDEFFMKRMAVHHAAADGATPAILELARPLIAAMVEEQQG